MIVIIIVLAVAFMLWLGSKAANEPGDVSEDCSIDTHRIYGEARVLYNDGYLSQPFYAETAKFYAEHFGGQVVPRNYNQRGMYRIPNRGWVNVPKGVTPPVVQNS